MKIIKNALPCVFALVDFLDHLDCLTFHYSAAPSAPPENFNAQPTSSRSATATWAPPPDDEINGVIVRYLINVTVVSTGRQFQLTSTTTTLTISTLTPYSTFICIIAAVTSVGIGPFSTQFTLITPQDGIATLLYSYNTR